MQSKRIGETVYVELKAGILNGTFPEGGKLPPESSLCKQYEVSRPVVREALARLQVEGLIASRQGSGTFVRKKTANLHKDPAFAPVKNLNDIQLCFDFRLSLEGEAAFHAAMNRQDADIEAAERAIEKFENAIASGARSEADDFAFHIAIAEASHIHFFPSVMESIRQHVMVGMSLAKELSRFESRQRLQMVHAEHSAVLEQVRARESEGARTAMREHIDESRRRLFLGSD